MPRILRPLAAVLATLALAGCTIQFTPGDARPATYTPYGMPGSYGEWWGGSDFRTSLPPR